MRMPACKHQTLTQLSGANNPKLRCRYCDLTISETELGDGYCPECYEVHQVKRYDFAKVLSEEKGKTRYRCEACGIIIECEQ